VPQFLVRRDTIIGLLLLCAAEEIDNNVEVEKLRLEYQVLIVNSRTKFCSQLSEKFSESCGQK
jgi:hypothetical protein